MRRLSSVTIDLFALDTLAEELAGMDLEAPQWREPWYPEDNDDFVQFIGVANALNFCYTKPGHEKFGISWNGMDLGGSAGLMAAIMRARDTGIDLLDATALSSITENQMKVIFASDAGPLPLMSERTAHLRALGATLLERYNGNVSEIFGRNEYDALRVVDALTRDFPVAYGGDNVQLNRRWVLDFDKRARLLPLMYEGRARSSEGALPKLKNAGSISPVIDYQVAKTLHANDVLLYGANLWSKIQRGEPLVAWGDEELSIRWHAHHATECLVKRVNQFHSAKRVTMVELDYALWSSGRGLKDIPHHLCMTTAY